MREKGARRERRDDGRKRKGIRKTEGINGGSENEREGRGKREKR